MNGRGILIIAILCWAMTGVSASWAGSGHSPAHAPGMMKVMSGDRASMLQAGSPFQQEPGGKRLHCDLLRHNPLLPCPHHQIPQGEKESCSLANDCGGVPGVPLLKTDSRPPFVPVEFLSYAPETGSDFEPSVVWVTPSPSLSIITPPPELS